MQVRLSKYLHRPWLLVMFEAQEWGIIFLFYFLGILGKGWWYLGVVIGPAVLIPLSRRLPRGLTNHYLAMSGLKKFHNFPPFYERTFYE